jgi:hypothetical protein
LGETESLGNSQRFSGTAKGFSGSPKKYKPLSKGEGFGERGFRFG